MARWTASAASSKVNGASSVDRPWPGRSIEHEGPVGLPDQRPPGRVGGAAPAVHEDQGRLVRVAFDAPVGQHVPRARRRRGPFPEERARPVRTRRFRGPPGCIGTRLRLLPSGAKPSPASESVASPYVSAVCPARPEWMLYHREPRVPGRQNGGPEPRVRPKRAPQSPATKYIHVPSALMAMRYPR